jgi:hypothetical protein
MSASGSGVDCELVLIREAADPTERFDDGRGAELPGRGAVGASGARGQAGGVGCTNVRLPMKAITVQRRHPKRGTRSTVGARIV